MSFLIRILMAALITTFTGRQANIVEAAALTPKIFVSPSGFTFDSGSGVSNRLLTPNGDRLNDYVVFSFNNPRDSAVSGAIYDLKGSQVASLNPGPKPPGGSAQSLIWDGKSGGQAVPGGVYIYMISSEDAVVTGTVVVVL